MDGDLTARKRAMRAEARRVLTAMSAQEVCASSAEIARAVLGWPPFCRARSIFCYVSVGKEPDTYPIIEAALTAGKAVYVPRCGPRPEMDAVRIRSPKALAPGTMGIPEPTGGEVALAVDLAIVPCLRLTPAGERLGHGGGYYDAYLAAHPSPTLCLCHPALLCEALPTGALDVRMGALVMEGRVRLCKG